MTKTEKLLKEIISFQRRDIEKMITDLKYKQKDLIKLEEIMEKIIK